jgi:hypothetical protein
MLVERLIALPVHHLAAIDIDGLAGDFSAPG